MKTPRTFPVVALIAVFAGLPVAPAFSEEVDLTVLYKDLAEANNYPVVQGLLGASAEVTCNIMDQVTAAFPEAAGAPIKVTFNWERADENSWPQKGFEVTGIPDGLTDLSKRAQLIFNDPKDFVIEDPVYWTIAQTQASATNSGESITVTGTGDQISSLTVDIDAGTNGVKKMVMEVGGTQYSFEMTREQMGDKYVVKSMVVTNPQATRNIKYEYAEIDGFILPTKMSVEYTGTEEPVFEYEFKNWQVRTAATEEVEGLG